MLEAPADVALDDLAATLHAAYGLDAPPTLAFLPLGADTGTAVFCATSAEQRYFVKLRRTFDPASALIPRWLADTANPALIPPIPAADGRLWSPFGAYQLALYPFVDGSDGYAQPLTEAEWRTLGAAARALHTAPLPPELATLLPRELFAPRWRRRLLRLLDPATPRVADPAADGLAALYAAHAATIAAIIDRAASLAAELAAAPPPFVLCHGDLHAGNVLIDGAGALFVVDWDTLILAPRERDLMFVGGAQGFIAPTPEDEELRFFAGYGPCSANPAALAYYRYERVIQDLVAYGDELFASEAGGADRAQALRYVAFNFQPGGTIERARAVDPALQRAHNASLTPA